jgi:hypothetical protein
MVMNYLEEKLDSNIHKEKKTKKVHQEVINFHR